MSAWVVGFVLIGDSWWQLASAVVLAGVMTQIAFLGHDAAHRQIFKSGRWNDWVSLIVANLLVGISYGWWQSKHNRHHANPNKEGADPDIALTGGRHDTDNGDATLQSTGALGRGPSRLVLLSHPAARRRLAAHRRRPARLRPRPVRRRLVELPFSTVRLAGLIALAFLVLAPEKALVFLAVELAVFGLYMGSAFAPNHIGMPLVSARLKLDFLRRQVLMSRNISGGPLVSIFMGGLNFQIEHHLFPSMARPNLHKAQALVSAYCVANGVPYTRTTLWQRVPERDHVPQRCRTARARIRSSARWLRNDALCDAGAASATMVTAVARLSENPGLLAGQRANR